MERPGFRDLVGRAILDDDFRAELIREPARVLAGFDLSDEEHTAVVKAVSRAAGPSDPEHVRTLQALMVRRWAT